MRISDWSSDVCSSDLGVPEGSRASLPGYEWLRELLTDEGRNSKVKALAGIAEELDCSLGQMAIAWCARNPRVSTVITGASSVAQVQENMAALDVLPKLTDELMARIKEDEIGSASWRERAGPAV